MKKLKYFVETGGPYQPSAEIPLNQSQSFQFPFASIKVQKGSISFAISLTTFQIWIAQDKILTSLSWVFFRAVWFFVEFKLVTE